MSATGAGACEYGGPVPATVGMSAARPACRRRARTRSSRSGPRRSPGRRSRSNGAGRSRGTARLPVEPAAVPSRSAPAAPRGIAPRPSGTSAPSRPGRSAAGTRRPGPARRRERVRRRAVGHLEVDDLPERAVEAAARADAEDRAAQGAERRGVAAAQPVTGTYIGCTQISSKCSRPRSSRTTALYALGAASGATVSAPSAVEQLPSATPPGSPASVAIGVVRCAPSAYSACTSNSVHSCGLAARGASHAASAAGQQPSAATTRELLTTRENRRSRAPRESNARARGRLAVGSRSVGRPLALATPACRASSARASTRPGSARRSAAPARGAASR